MFPMIFDLSRVPMQSEDRTAISTTIERSRTEEEGT